MLNDYTRGALDALAWIRRYLPEEACLEAAELCPMRAISVQE